MIKWIRPTVIIKIVANHLDCNLYPLKLVNVIIQDKKIFQNKTFYFFDSVFLSKIKKARPVGLEPTIA